MRQFGLIGYPLGHSFSKKYFAEKFEREHIEGCHYDAYSIPQIADLPSLLKTHANLVGLNVTIPYKEQVLPYLDELSPAVEEMRACNCIKIRDGRLIGFNTDVYGFKTSLLESFPNLPSKALILGTGGASKAVAFALQQLQIPFLYVSRNASANARAYEQIDATTVKAYPLIINTTPLGMAPHTEDCPPIPYEAMGPEHACFDLIYNPSETRFMQKAKAQGAAVKNGLDMLVLQAEESWRIWNDPSL